MKKINSYKNKFYKLLESEMGNVKPLINEEEEFEEYNEEFLESEDSFMETDLEMTEDDIDTKIRKILDSPE